MQADLIHRDQRLINFKDSELRELHVGLCPAAGSVLQRKRGGCGGSVRQRKRGLVPMVKPGKDALSYIDPIAHARRARNPRNAAGSMIRADAVGMKLERPLAASSRCRA